MDGDGEMKKLGPDKGFKNLLFWMVLYLLVEPFFLGLPYAHILLGLSFSFVFFFPSMRFTGKTMNFLMLCCLWPVPWCCSGLGFLIC